MANLNPNENSRPHIADMMNDPRYGSPTAVNPMIGCQNRGASVAGPLINGSASLDHLGTPEGFGHADNVSSKLPMFSDFPAETRAPIIEALSKENADLIMVLGDFWRILHSIDILTHTEFVLRDVAFVAKTEDPNSSLLDDIISAKDLGLWDETFAENLRDLFLNRLYDMRDSYMFMMLAMVQMRSKTLMDGQQVNIVPHDRFIPSSLPVTPKRTLTISSIPSATGIRIDPSAATEGYGTPQVKG